MPGNPNNSERFERLRKQAEQLIQQQPNFPDQNNLLNIFYEMQVAHKELEIQAEELKRTQDDLASLHQEYENYRGSYFLGKNTSHPFCRQNTFRPVIACCPR